MKLAIMQPYFFPYIGYFQLIHAVDKFILYDHVNFIKKGWINRNRILEINKGPKFIHVPVKGASSYRTIRETRIDHTVPWQKKNLDMIFYNYKRAAYFDEIFPFISSVMNARFDFVSEFNHHTLSSICRLLRIDVLSNENPEFYKNLENEINDKESVIMGRYATDFGINEKKTIRILEICRFKGADVYVNAPGGVQLYDRQSFLKNQISLRILNTLPFKYDQKQEQFSPHLSIIDVLMHNGVKETKRLLTNYQLI